MHKIWTIGLMLALSTPLFSQKPLVWQVLGMTTYETDMDAFGNASFVPHYPALLEDRYENEEVAIAGYLIPIDLEAGKYALSKNPFTSCFFCGNAGPETVIELRFEEAPGRFATDEYLMIKGTLQLNRNGSGLFFVLKNAQIHG